MTDADATSASDDDPFAGTRRALDARRARQEAFLDVMLIHAPFDGWSDLAIRNAIKESDFDLSEVQRLFPKGAKDLLAFLDDWADQTMADSHSVEELSRLRVHERVHALVMARLTRLDPHREALRRASAAGLMPGLGLPAMRRLWQTIDKIWLLAGDEARDINRYTKRGLLTAAYGATILYWLDQQEYSLEDTSDFLMRRLSQAMKFGKSAGKLGKAAVLLRPARSTR